MDSKTWDHERQLTAKQIRKLSYREGDFTLASGQKSKFYIDLKSSTLHSETAFRICKLLQALVEEKFDEPPGRVAGVGGLTLGADPLATGVAMLAYQAGREWMAFLVRKDAKEHGTSKVIEGLQNLEPEAGVVILEDVATTGKSSLLAVERAREAGLRVLGVVSIVDREAGARSLYQELGLEFFSLFTLQEIQNA
jgi:orotate phosphoribosyltransferase